MRGRGTEEGKVVEVEEMKKRKKNMKKEGERRRR
jgi:hypothetical protein